MDTARLWILVLFLCVQRRLAQTDDDEEAGLEWSGWSHWSACSTDCGRGVSTRSRDCMSTVTGDVVDGCTGEDEAIRVCEETGCLKEVTTSKECRKLQHRVYAGKRYRWEPYLHPSKPCELACRPLGAGFYLGLDMHVPDGSKCGEEGADSICVQGQCRAVGCDGVVGSRAVADQCGVCAGDWSTCKQISHEFTKPLGFGYHTLAIIPISENGVRAVGCDGVVGSRAVADQCGVCAGDGSTCKQISHEFTEPLGFGYHTLATIPRGATAIMVTEMHQSRNYLAVKATDQSFQLNTMYRLSRFGDHPGADTLFTYARGTGPTCPDECISAAGPLLVPVEVQVLVYTDETAVKVTYNLPSYAQDYTHTDEDTSPLVQIETGVIHAATSDASNTIKQSGIKVSGSTGTGSVRKSKKPIFSHDFKFGQSNRQRHSGKNVDITNELDESDSDEEELGSVEVEVDNDNSITGATGALSDTVTANRKADDYDIDNTGETNEQVANNTVLETNINEHTPADEDIDTDNKTTAGNTVTTGTMTLEDTQEDTELEDDDDDMDDAGLFDDDEEEVDSESETISSEITDMDDEDESEEESEDDSLPESDYDSTEKPEALLDSKADNTTDGSTDINLASTDDDDDTINATDATEVKLNGDVLSGTKADNESTAIEVDTDPANTAVGDMYTSDNTIPSLYEWSITGYTQCSHTCGQGKQTQIIACLVTDKGVTVDDKFCANLLKPEETVKPCGHGPCPPSWEAQPWSKCSTTCGVGVQTRDYRCVRADGRVANGRECGGSGMPRREERACDAGACTAGWYYTEWENEERACDAGACMAGWYYTEWENECPAVCGYGTLERLVTCISGTGNVNTACPPREKPVAEKSCRNDDCGGFWLTGPWSKCNATCGAGYQTRAVTCAQKHRDRISVVSEYACPEDAKPATYMSCDLPGCGPEWFMNDWGECSVTCGSGQRSRDVRCLTADKRASSGCDSASRPADREACTTRTCPISDQAPPAPTRPRPTRRPKKPKVTPSNDPHCKDRFDQCSLVLQARLCSYQYYRKVCCKSCSMIGR